MPRGISKYSKTTKSIFATLVAGMLFSCQNEIKEVRNLTEKSDLPLQTMYDVEFNYTVEGALKNKLIADKLDRFAGEENLLVADEGFELVIFDTLGHRESVLQADYGIFDEDERKMTARNDVIFRNIKGETLTTEELFWRQDSGIVHTDKLVKIVTANNDVIVGENGLVSNESFTDYRLNGITGELNVDEQTIGKKSADSPK